MRDHRLANSRWKALVRTSLVVSAAVVAGVVATAAVALAPSGGDSRSKDRDGDGLEDRFERTRSHTNPKRRDTDRDGLGDRFELRRSKTNPRSKDTDGDGLSDHFEVRRSKTNPRKRNFANGPPTDWPFPPRAGWKCDRRAGDSSELNDQWDAARPGETICLGTADYGTFRAGSKPGVVAVRPQAGALPTMSLEFDGASNVLVEGISIRGGELRGNTRNVRLARNRFTSHLGFDGLTNSNVVLDGNTHNDINSSEGDRPARIHLAYGCSGHSGVTIRNSLLAGGDSDGVQASCGVNVINNEFREIRESGGSNHTDNVQLLTAPGSVVRGNWVHAGGTTQGIAAYDGLVSAIIEDNVVDIRRGWGIEVYSDDGSIIRHNTLRYYAPGCYYGEPCGKIDISRKYEDDAGRGTVVVDNVTTAVGAANGSEIAERHRNLVRQFRRGGDLRGAPVFAGGSAPKSYADFRLAPRSPGKNAASDGRDIGIR